MEYHHHISKVLHGWRELAKEIGIIVIGVLIALGASQTVDWLHRRSEVSEARDALKAEIALNSAVARFTLAHERCLSARLDQYDAWARGGADAAAPSMIVTNMGWQSPATTAWDTAKAGAVAHMPLAERLAYTGYYGALQGDLKNVAIEVDIWMRLRGEVAAGGPLEHADARRLLEDVGQARGVGRLRSEAASRRIERTKTVFGVTPRPISAQFRQQLAEYCRQAGVVPTFE